MSQQQQTLEEEQFIEEMAHKYFYGNSEERKEAKQYYQSLSDELQVLIHGMKERCKRYKTIN